MGTSAGRIVQYCLIGLALALLSVGIVSGTLLRHIVQIVPILVVMGVLTRRRDVGAYAALPIFLFWIFIVVLIWLFLLGLSRIASGRYTLVEIVMTFLMAGFSLFGVGKAIPLGRSSRIGAKVWTFALFAGLQFAAMWVSFLKPIANR